MAAEMLCVIKNEDDFMKATFLEYNKPLLTAMVQETTPDEAINVILNCHYQGAEAFCIQLECFEKKHRNLEDLKMVFDACMGKPIYITSYRENNSIGLTDEECVDLLLLGCEAGATLCDVMGDAFDPQPHELTFDEEAIRKQQIVIDKIHEMGKEVLISTHTHAFLDEETIIKYALEQKRRGADVVKIVNMAETREQLCADMNIVFRLNKELGDTKFLFLANGEYCRPLRQFGAAFGVCMYLCVPSYKFRYSKEQPLLSSMKSIRDNTMFLKD